MAFNQVIGATAADLLTGTSHMSYRDGVIYIPIYLGSKVHMQMSSDLGATWSESDAAHAPAATGLQVIASARNSIIHVVAKTATTTLTCYRFDMDAGLWISDLGVVTTDAASNTSTYHGVYPRPDGSVVVVYRSQATNTTHKMSVWGGASWSITDAYVGAGVASLIQGVVDPDGFIFYLLGNGTNAGIAMIAPDNIVTVSVVPGTASAVSGQVIAGYSGGSGRFFAYTSGFAGSRVQFSRLGAALVLGPYPLDASPLGVSAIAIDARDLYYGASSMNFQESKKTGDVWQQTTIESAVSTVFVRSGILVGNDLVTVCRVNNILVSRSDTIPDPEGLIAPIVRIAIAIRR